MKTKRIKPTPLGNRAEFLAVVNDLAQLELQRRQIEVRRDGALLGVNELYDREAAPVVEQIKAKVALAAAWAKEHRAELLPKGVKSLQEGTATVGFRLGNRTVALALSGEETITKLKAIGLGEYVRTKEEVSREGILIACRNGKTIAITTAAGKKRQVAIARAGLKITQGESFYVEPNVPSAETLNVKTGEERAA